MRHLPYTIDQIDAALVVMSGNRAVRRGDPGWSRPLCMLDAAAQAWIEERPQDEHSLILRSALQDMNATGVLNPHDGIWPEG